MVSVFIFVLAQTVRIGGDHWISTWTSDLLMQPQWFYIAVYAGFSGAFLVSLFLRGIVIYTFADRASRKLHNTLFRRIISAPVYFFTVTPLGPLLNCFGRDQDAVDDTLPGSTDISLIYFLILLTTVVLDSVVLPLFAIVGGVLFIAFIVMYIYFAKAGNEVDQRIANTNGPLLAHIAETLQGMLVVCAFGAETAFKARLRTLLDQASSASYTQEHINIWLALRLDVIAVILVAVSVIICLPQVSPGLAASTGGLVITNSMQIIIFFTLAVKGISNATIQLPAVARIYKVIQEARDDGSIQEEIAEYASTLEKSYSKTSVCNIVPMMQSQPSRKSICRFIMASVLLSLEEQDRVNRLFSWCCSVSSTLRRESFVDGRDIGELDLHKLRGRLAINPQDPVLFTGTIRSNLNPFGMYTDEDLVKALRKAHLGDFVKSLLKGLNTDVTPDDLSLGQKQLLCMARAVVKHSKILVLDEATSAMDPATDNLVQQTMRTAFEGHTIIKIAHRLNTILDYDRVLVMDSGVVAEFDTVSALLSKDDSIFWSLVKAANIDPTQ